MEKELYNEMVENLNRIDEELDLASKKIFLFGHCNATLELTDLLVAKGLKAIAILDNSKVKQGQVYKGAVVIDPKQILEISGKQPEEESIVLITSRFYAAMLRQLREIGYEGLVRKVIDYNSYAEYSLSPKTIARKRQRLERGIVLLRQMQGSYPDCFKILCPFSALGDIYFTMSYLPHFMKKRGLEKCVVGVIGKACGQVVRLFGHYPVEVLAQKDMDEMIQAALYTEDENTFIPHQDRPYVVNLFKALYIKRIPLETIYCCGVFGLPVETRPCLPTFFRPYDKLEEIPEGGAVILSPYAKSVTALKPEIWGQIIRDYQARGYVCYTNVARDEKPLPDTIPISPEILQMRSVIERAGTFIGIRSGLCDVIREASCRKIALYPDYYYCDTKWKAIDMYWLEGWENIVIEEDFSWSRR